MPKVSLNSVAKLSYDYFDCGDYAITVFKAVLIFMLGQRHEKRPSNTQYLLPKPPYQATTLPGYSFSAASKQSIAA